MRRDRREAHDGDRISKIFRETMESDLAREAGQQIKAFITRKPILSACLGLAAGLAIGMLIRRRD